MSDEIYYYFGLLGQFNKNSACQRSPYNVEGQSSRFGLFMHV